MSVRARHPLRPHHRARGTNRRSTLLAVALVALGATRGVAAQQRERGIHDDPRGRIDYLYRQRAYPQRQIPAGVRRRAYDQLRAGGAIAPRRPGADVIGGWTAIGPGSIPGLFIQSAGRVTAIAPHPVDPNIIYAGGAQGGVWRSADGGATWTPLTDAECSLAIGSIAIDPVNPDIVYAGTGEMNFSRDSYYGCGVLRSIDGGATWEHLGGAIFDTPTGGARVSKVLVDEGTAGTTDATVVLAATTFGLYRSADAGRSWTRTLASATDLVQDPNHADVLYAAVSNPFGGPTQSTTTGVYQSLDRGLTWSLRPNGFPTDKVGRIALALSSADPVIIYAAVQTAIDSSGNGGNLLGLWTSADSGATWQERDAQGVSCGTQCWYDLVMTVDPTRPSVVYFGGLGLYRSTDGGDSFRDISGGIHVDQHALALLPSDHTTLLAGNDGGVYRITSLGTSSPDYTSLNRNLSVTQFYHGISSAPGAPLTVLGGSQDNGTVEYRGSQSWLEALGGDGGYTAMDPQRLGTSYAETEWIASSGFSGPWRRDDASGGEFVRKVSGITESDRAEFIPPLVMDPVSPSVLYFGTSVLYRSADRGESWTSPRADLSAQAGRGTISSIGIGKSNPKVIFVGTSDGAVRVSLDAGLTFSQPLTGLPNRYVTSIAVDPSNARHAYVTMSGFQTGHIWETTDRGATWRNITGSLPDMPVNALVLQPATGELDIGTDLGVFASVDDGRSWNPLSTGFPAVAVFDLVLEPRTNTLVAATHGRGMFTLQLSSTAVLRGDANNDGRITAADAQVILAASLGLPVPTGAKPLPNGDANCDGRVSAVDAEMVLVYVVGGGANGCVGVRK